MDFEKEGYKYLGNLIDFYMEGAPEEFRKCEHEDEIKEERSDHFSCVTYQYCEKCKIYWMVDSSG